MMGNEGVIDRIKAAPIEARMLGDAIAPLVAPFKFKKVDEYWMVERQEYWTPPEQSSFRMIFRNKSIEMIFGIFDLTSYSVQLDIKKAKAEKWDDCFDVGDFAKIIKLPRYVTPDTYALRGEAHIEHFIRHFGQLLQNEIFVAILTGKFWFPLRVDPREWNLGVQEKMGKNLAEAWSKRLRVVD